MFVYHLFKIWQNGIVARTMPTQSYEGTANTYLESSSYLKTNHFSFNLCQILRADGHCSASYDKKLTKKKLRHLVSVDSTEDLASKKIKEKNRTDIKHTQFHSLLHLNFTCCIVTPQQINN